MANLPDENLFCLKDINENVPDYGKHNKAIHSRIWATTSYEIVFFFCFVLFCFCFPSKWLNCFNWSLKFTSWSNDSNAKGEGEHVKLSAPCEEKNHN